VNVGGGTSFEECGPGRGAFWVRMVSSARRRKEKGAGRKRGLRSQGKVGARENGQKDRGSLGTALKRWGGVG